MFPKKDYHKIQSQKNTQNTFSTNGYCEAAKLILQGSKITPTLYVLTLGGCDIVLGVDWLSVLSPILWDFIKNSMKFLWEKKELILKGMQPWKISLEGGEKIIIPTTSTIPNRNSIPIPS